MLVQFYLGLVHFIWGFSSYPADQFPLYFPLITLAMFVKHVTSQNKPSIADQSVEFI